MKKVRNFFLSILLYISLMLVHEFGHGIGAIVTGGGFEGIGINIEGFKSNLYAKCWCENITCVMSVYLFGALTAICVSTLLFYVFYKKENVAGCIVTMSYTASDIFYWLMSPHTGSGDAYHFLNLYELFHGEVDLLLYTIIMIIILMVIITIYYAKFIKMVNKKYVK